MDTLATYHQPSLLEKVLSESKLLSIASPEIAVSRPLAEIVQATITGACNSKHSERSYSRFIAEFIKMLGEEYPNIFYQPLVEFVKDGKRILFNFGDIPSGVLLLVSPSLLDKYQREHKQGIYAVKSLLGVALRDKVIPADLATTLGIKPFVSRVKRNSKPVGRRLDRIEVKQLRESVDASTKTGKRDLAILDTMLYAGLRREEVSSLMLSDFVKDKGQWHVDFSGKGDKQRKIAIHPKLLHSLENWLEVYGYKFGDNAPLFTMMRRGEHIKSNALTSQSIGELVAHYGYISELATETGKDRLSAHDLRRTFARNLYDNGAGLPAIQIILGHADVKTTTHYIGVGSDDASNVIGKVDY